MGKIYKIINTINSKVYVGKTIKSLNYRFGRHLINANKKINRHLYDSINHYGKEAFKIELIEECADEILSKREIYWISKYKSNQKEFGYNMTDGGDGGKMQPESIERMRLKKTGRKTSDETKKKQSKSQIGKHVGDLNVAKRPEVKEKISKTLKKKYKNGEIKSTLQENIIKSGKKLGFNRNHSDIAKEKMSKFRLGKTYEEIYGVNIAIELKEKQKNRFIGNNNPNYIEIDANIILKYLKMGRNNQQISKELHISAATVIDKFKRKFGLTPQQYLKQM
jgi:group I intron endonuclease